MKKEQIQVVSSFLSGDLADEDGDEYSPRSGPVLGALGQLVRQMEEEVTKLEGQRGGFTALEEAKQREITAVFPAVQTETNKVGLLGVEIAQLKASTEKMNVTLVQDGRSRSSTG